MYTLEAIDMFSKLDEKHQALIKKKIRIKYFQSDKVVFYEGDQSQYLYLLLEGKIKLYSAGQNGSEIHLTHFEAPQPVAIYAYLQNKPFPATCRFVDDGAMGLLHIDDFHALMRIPEFSEALAHCLSSQVMMFSDILHQETQLTSEAKVADLLLKNNNIFKEYKKHDIAKILNITPETLSRVLTKFKKDTLINLDKTKLRILNIKVLEDIVNVHRII
ncbi:MAG: Crp/Fnr family transcriptional regulator [Campylobacterota bacterium]|nr:Crp/Fnr family transcriptional regulator [Campylobacterota bacterium]